MAELIVERYGAFVGKHSERVRVSLKGEVVEERPLYGLEHVLVLSGGVSLSSDVIRECAERGIDITFLSGSGVPYARLISPALTGTVRTRREQLLAYLDGRGVTLCKAFVAGKLANQATLLRYLAKNRRQKDFDRYDQAREAAFRIQDYGRQVQGLRSETVDALRQELMTLEAHGAKLYWEAMRELLVPDVGWEGRETRGATDLVNSLLNYGYGILYSHVERAILLAGLDPYAGYLHVDRAGKPSLVLDLIEEFRQMVVDRTVFGLLNRGATLEVEEGRLTEPTRRLLAERVNERLDGEEPYEGKKHKLRTVLMSQARHLATFVRGEGKPYTPFVGRW
ncbi:MAG: CRISPR-associated endonuclease Cas1 [Chloroflexi bacterium]|nr:CRISPR-associated endonuclease Cas1 [Chloroflexota bacterium]